MILTQIKFSPRDVKNNKIYEHLGLHRIIYKIFAGHDRVLYADKGMQSGFRKVVILSDKAPENNDFYMETKTIPDAFFKLGAYRFQIDINPVKRGKEVTDSEVTDDAKLKEATAKWHKYMDLRKAVRTEIKAYLENTQTAEKHAKELCKYWTENPQTQPREEATHILREKGVSEDILTSAGTEVLVGHVVKVLETGAQEFIDNIKDTQVTEKRRGVAIKYEENRKLVPITNYDEIASWFADKAKKWGFETAASALTVNSVSAIKFQKNDGNIVTINSANISGTIKVTDEELFAKSFRDGLGRAKAYGQGLLQLMPIKIF